MSKIFFTSSIDYNDFNNSGVYGIVIDNRLVYVGKSKNMWRRIKKEHIKYIENEKCMEKKYVIMREAAELGLGFKFVVLYCGKDYGEQEKRLIEKYKPLLNTWRWNGETAAWERDNRVDTLTLGDILKNVNKGVWL